MEFISNRVNVDSGLDKTKTYLGKMVMSKSGEKIGRVTDLRLKGAHMLGIVVRGNLFIDREFLASIEDTIMLSIDPVTSIVGKTVFDGEGRKIGKVKELIREHTGNEYKALLVKKGMFSKLSTIPKSHVDVSENNVILK